MKPRTLQLLDALSAALLGLWATTALVALLAGAFEPLRLGRWLDHGAWLAFGASLALSYGGRWLSEIQDEAPIGPLRLWSAAALAALLVCMSSSLLVGPRWRELAALDPGSLGAAGEAALRRARSLSVQFLVLRALLALGLAAGLRCLPRETPHIPEDPA